MKYILKPFWWIIIILLTLFDIMLCILHLAIVLLWNFKLKQSFGESWKELHTNALGWNDNFQTVYGWDETIWETVVRRFTNGEYKHKE